MVSAGGVWDSCMYGGGREEEGRVLYFPRPRQNAKSFPRKQMQFLWVHRGIVFCLDRVRVGRSRRPFMCFVAGIVMTGNGTRVEVARYLIHDSCSFGGKGSMWVSVRDVDVHVDVDHDQYVV
eukprot:gene12235-biopygen6849